MQDRVNVLLVGCGGIGTIAALNLECGKQAAVTAVLRSNHDIVKQRGFNIRSIDHGVVNGFKPSNSEHISELLGVRS
jgi:ketopantoate reductase